MIVWLAIVLLSQLVSGDNILVVLPTSAKSHFLTFEPLCVELAKRGHNAVVISQFPQKYKIHNYTDIYIPPVGNLEQLEKELVQLSNFNPSKLNNIVGKIYFLFELLAELDVLVLEKSLEFLNDSYKFDLIIVELFNTDLFLGYAHKYKAPIVAISSCTLVPWVMDRFGMSFNYDIYRKMSLLQKVNEMVKIVILKTVYSYRYLSRIERTAKRFFGEDMPSLDELSKNTSLVLVNTHFSIYPQVYPPQVVEVSGLHLKAKRQLSKDIESFINESKHGVIYFSFGSIVKSSTMKESTVRVFCDVFSQLPQRVIWKWESEDMPEKPDNVKLLKWAPQRDILAHPNIKMFISHGGLLGVTEAIHSGVPILGIPFYGDQMQNIENLVESGMAVYLDYFNISTESLTHAVDTVLNVKKFKENALHMSRIFNDRPHTPLDTAVYWIEYVLRHKGAHHLRTTTVHLPWYQYFLLDIILVLVCFTIIASIVCFYCIKIILGMCSVDSKKNKIQ